MRVILRTGSIFQIVSSAVWRVATNLKTFTRNSNKCIRIFVIAIDLNELFWSFIENFSWLNIIILITFWHFEEKSNVGWKITEILRVHTTLFWKCSCLKLSKYMVTTKVWWLPWEFEVSKNSWFPRTIWTRFWWRTDGCTSNSDGNQVTMRVWGNPKLKLAGNFLIKPQTLW